MPRVAIISPDGQFGTIDESHVAEIERAGGRVLTKQENAARALDEEYDKKSTAEKIGGGVAATLAGPVVGSALTGAGVIADDPTHEAFQSGLASPVTLGLERPATRAVIDATSGPEAAKAYAQRQAQVDEAHPDARTAGEVAGFAALALGGSGGGVARAVPGLGVSALGGAAESATARALGGLAARGALGRAATTGASLAARGVVEGAAFSGGQELSNQLLHDTPVNGEKLYTAMGNGAFAGGAMGFGLGFAGSLAASGVKGLGGLALRGVNRAGSKAEQAVTEEIVKDATPKRLLVDPDVGLRDLGPTPESPFRFGGAERRPMQVRPDIGQRGRVPTAEAPFDFSGGKVGIDAAGAEAGIARRGPGGKFQGALEATDALKPSSAKGVPREVSLGPTGETLAKAELPIPLERAAAAEAPAAKLGVTDLLSRPSEAAHALAADQAWNAIGAGQGLQTTRFAKEGARHFPNGTRDLGEVALKYNVIDIPQNASPLQAAMQAAKSGTPAEILPKLEAAGESVGKRIGEITETSGARVPLSEVQGAIANVRQNYGRIAGYEHVVRALDDYEAALLSKLTGAPDGTASVQAVLEQRKGLGQLVLEENRTLDPKGRVAALREVRTGIEDVITKALDDASGRVPGALRDEYKALKKDFHALRILREAAEDSAARSSKGATFGLGDKIIGGAAAAIGGAIGGPIGAVVAGPGAALAGKILRERGNAAAAAFLQRAADSGSMARLVGAVDAQVSKAARGVLREAPAAPSRKPAQLSVKASAQPAQVQAKALQISKWVAEVRANPERLMDQLKEASAIVGRSAGPQAASAYTMSSVKALEFVAGYLPVKERLDPLDPRSVPPMTFEEADRVVRAASYAAQPMRVWKDFDRGIVTPEGLAAANTFMPEQLAEFRQQLFAHVTDRMMRREELTQSQRLRVDKLLGFGAGRPAEVARLQANFQNAPPSADAPPAAAAPPSGNKPVGLKVQQTGYDAIEARQASG